MAFGSCLQIYGFPVNKQGEKPSFAIIKKCKQILNYLSGGVNVMEIFSTFVL